MPCATSSSVPRLKGFLKEKTFVMQGGNCAIDKHTFVKSVAQKTLLQRKS